MQRVYAIVKVTTLVVGLLWPVGHILSFLHIYDIPHEWMQLSRAMALARLAMFVAGIVYAVTRRKPGIAMSVAVTEQIPPLILRLIRAEVSVYRNFHESVFGAKNTPRPGFGFSFCDGPRFREIPYVIGLSFLVETPILYFIVRYQSRPDIRTLMDAAIVVLTLYSMVFLRADRFALRQSRHALTATGIKFELGIRMHGIVPYAAIDSTEMVPSNERVHKIIKNRSNAERFLVCSPSDRPNVLIMCRPDRVFFHHILKGTLSPAILAVYVDKPREFLAAIENKRQTDGSREAP